MKKLYKFLVDCFRSGVVESVFIANEEDVAAIIGKEDIYFGEILGKHSEIVINIEANDIKELPAEPFVIEALEKIFVNKDKFQHSYNTITISGYNPIIYVADDAERRLEEQEEMWMEEESKRQWTDEQRRWEEQKHWEEQNEV